MQKFRNDHDLPESIVEWGWKYHHLGIPTNIKRPDEKYIPELKMYVSGFNNSPFGIEWMRFEEDTKISKLIQSLPHIAFEVEDLDYELSQRKLKIISEPAKISKGIRVAMIKHNDAPIELIEFQRINK